MWLDKKCILFQLMEIFVPILPDMLKYNACYNNIQFILMKIYVDLFHKSEAATRGVLFKQGFVKISQNSQENTCARVSKKEALGQVFSCEFCEILRTPFLQNTSGRLLLIGAILDIFPRICSYKQKNYDEIFITKRKIETFHSISWKFLFRKPELHDRL